MEKLLKDFRPGEIGMVRNVKADGKIRRRLFDMGVTPGAELTLRKTEAETVIMEVSE